MLVAYSSSSLRLVDCSLPGPSVHGIFQARRLEWVAIFSSRGLPDPGIERGSPTLQEDSSPWEPPWRGNTDVNWCGLCGNSAEIPQQAGRRVRVAQRACFQELMLILSGEVTLGRCPRLGAGFQGTHRERRWTSGYPQCHRAAWRGCEPPTPHTVNPCRFSIAFTKILK